MEKSNFQCRVYYEDTDLAGIVYYANYLKFIERARSEWVRSIGLDQNVLRKDHGIVFAVRKVEADYLKSAKFDDLLTITTELKNKTRVRLKFCQHVYRGNELIFTAILEIVPVGVSGHLMKLPKTIYDKFT